MRARAQTEFGLYLTPHEAYNLLHSAAGDEVLFVDIRSRAELKYTGASILIDANIPYRFIDPDFGWSEKSSTYRTERNDHFIEDLERLLAMTHKNKLTPVILICTSGTRAPRAASDMKTAGFETVYSVYQGFEGIKAKHGINRGKRLVYGWKSSGLPWSYALEREAMYFNFDSTLAKVED